MVTPAREETPQRGRLPTVVVSSVVRSSHQGDSHGGVYLVDLQSETVRQVLDWDRSSIDWEGRGGDRGLRGIAFHEGRVLLAASDEMFVFDRHFQLERSFRNPYLKHCHEIHVAGDSLYLTSTRFDSVLEYDLAASAFRVGYSLRLSRLRQAIRRLGISPRPSFSMFDPAGSSGPGIGDTCHLNSVFSDGSTLFVAGTRLGHVYSITGTDVRRYARIPYGSHNARPHPLGVLLNHTASNRVCLTDRGGRLLRSWPIPEYEESRLLERDLPKDHARQAFARGLAVIDDELIVGGSSPATISVYRIDSPEVVKTINVTMDVRNAVHGLEVWPFDEPGGPNVPDPMGGHANG